VSLDHNACCDVSWQTELLQNAESDRADVPELRLKCGVDGGLVGRDTPKPGPLTAWHPTDAATVAAAALAAAALTAAALASILLPLSGFFVLQID
jgi:hypothetical protein